MPDLEKVIKGLEHCGSADMCDKCPYLVKDIENEGDGCQMFADALTLLKAKEPRWISVKDRLPENDDKVLCCTRTAKGIQNIIIGYYMGGMWRCGMNSNVTHWMPLPEPPKEG